MKTRCPKAIFFVSIAFIFAHIKCQDRKWESIGPYLGNINCMAMDMDHPDTLFAATTTGVYRSYDGAESWVKTGLDGSDINSVLVAPSNSKIILAATDYMVQISTDQGASWTEIWQSERAVGSVAFNPEDASVIWIGINLPALPIYEPNLFRSADGGSSWSSVHFPRRINAFGEEGKELKLTSVNALVIDPSDTAKIYAGGLNESARGCMFVSHNSGSDWTENELVTCTGQEVLSMVVTPRGHEPHAIYAMVWDHCKSGHILFSSNDQGGSWIPESVNTNDFGSALAIDPVWPNWVLIGAHMEDASLATYDSEEGKFYTYPGSPHSFPTSILMHPKINDLEKVVLYLGFKKDGVYKSLDNGSTWTPKNRGFNNVEVHDLLTYPEDPYKLMVAMEDGLAKSGDKGAHWVILDQKLNSLALHMNDTSLVWGGSKPMMYPNYGDPIYGYASTNGGTSWESKTLFTRGGAADFGYTLWSSDILIFGDDTGIILAGIDGGGGCGEGLYRSIDGGDTWDQNLSTGVSCIASDPTKNNVIYLGTTNSGYLFRSEDGGVGWIKASSVSVDNVWDLDVDKNGQVITATSSGLYKWEVSEDWSLLQTFPFTTTTAVVVDNQPVVPCYYVGTSDQGIFISENGGLSWEEYNNGLESFDISTLELSQTNPRYLFAGTKNGGVWKTELKANTTSAGVIMEPESVLSVYPNPGHGRLNLVNCGKQDLRGSLKVVNLSGQVVFSSYHVEVPTAQAIEISLDQASSGSYILIFTDEKSTIFRKVIVTL